MATLRTVIVDTDSSFTGWDYTTLTSAEANEQGDISSTTGTDEYVEIECYATSGTEDSAQADFAGWTTETTNYIEVITPAGSYRHSETWNTNIYRITSNSGSCIIVQQEHFRLTGIQVYLNNNVAGRYAVNLNNTGEATSEFNFSHNLLRGNGGTTYSQRMIDIEGGNSGQIARVWNNFIYDVAIVASASRGIYCQQSGITYIHNNTIIGGTDGIYITSTGTSSIKNNICQDADANGISFAVSVEAATENNVIDDSTLTADAAGGTGSDLKTGTATSYTANKLNDSGGGLSVAKIGSVVVNTTDVTYARVTAIDSDTVLSLSADIFDTGNEAYRITSNIHGTVTFDGSTLKLSASDTYALNNGVNLYSHSNCPVVDDILGTIRPQASIFDIGGFELIQNELSPTEGDLAFGEESPTGGETPVEWSLFSDGAAGSPEIIGDADWGKIALEYTEVAHSPVYDFTDSASRTISLVKDLYGSGSGNPTVQIRGHDSTLFGQDDGTPSWETYSTPVAKTWRYIQVRIIYSV